MPPPKGKAVKGIGGNSTVPHPAVEIATADPVAVRQQRSFSDIFLHHSGYSSDKWSQFLPIYDIELQSVITRGRPVRLLEIGVQNGGSLQVWHEYLPKGSQIYGIDIDERCRKLTFPPAVKVLIGDAGNRDRLDELLDEEKFDVIIDDGSHQSTDVIEAFQALLPRLTPGGKYFVEDLHASYWRSYGGGFRKAGASIEYFKNLVDALHSDYFQPNDIISYSESHSLTELNADIGRITFYDSIAVIAKYPKQKLARFNRVLSGKQMRVTGPDHLIDSIAVNPDGLKFYGGASDTIISAAAKEISHMRGEAHRAQAEAEQRAATEAGLRAEIEQRAATEAGLRAAIEQRIATEAELRAAIEQRIATDAELRAAIEQRTATEAELRAQVERHAVAEAALRADLEQRAATEAALQAEIEEGVLAETALRHSLDQVERAQQEHAIAVKDLDAELGIARNALAEAEHRRQQAEIVISGLHHQVASLRQELSIVRAVGSAAIAALQTEVTNVPSGQLRIAGPRGDVLRSFGFRSSVHGR